EFRRVLFRSFDLFQRIEPVFERLLGAEAIGQWPERFGQRLEIFAAALAEVGQGGDVFRGDSALVEVGAGCRVIEVNALAVDGVDQGTLFAELGDGGPRDSSDACELSAGN